MEERIIKEMKKKKIGINGMWMFQEYNPFYWDLNQREREEFDNCIKKMLKAGVLEEIKDNTAVHYKLTDVGYRVLYSIN